MYNPSGMEQIIGSKEPENVSSGLIAKAGQRLGLRKETITELIKPQSINIYRLPVEVFGRIINVWGCIVLHNNARGPYKGGIRLAPDVDVWETTELARLMTLKTAVTGIEFGGGKTGIRLDIQELYRLFDIQSRSIEFEGVIKRAIFKEYGSKFSSLFSSHTYIPAPDMGTGGEQMTEIYNITGDPAAVTGKPEGVHGWLPGRKESTGYGVSVAALETLNYLEIAPSKAKVAIQGFGNVAAHTAYYLSQQGIKIVGVTDLSGGVYNKDGLDIESLMEYASENGCVAGFPGDTLTNDQLFSLDVDALIPAAAGHVLNARTSKMVRAKAVVSGANMPATQDGMEVLEANKVFVFPDIVANAGGVIASNMEYSGSLSAQHRQKAVVLKFVEERIRNTFNEIMAISEKETINLTEASILLAVMRIKESMLLRGWLSSTSCDLNKLTNGKVTCETI
jgi:glutamate dehydrogenase/leucine dehydrogenase